MHLFVPACGDRIVLTSDWAFQLHDEHRNRNFAWERFPHMTPDDFGIRWKNHHTPIGAVLSVGTILECDRVYIKTASKSFVDANDSYDSITFKVVVLGKARMKERFWVKLSDANQIQFQMDSFYRDRK